MVRLLAVTLTLSSLLACTGSSTPKASTASSATAIEVPPKPTELVGKPLATVNGLKVGSTEFLKAGERQLPASGTAWSESEKRALLDKIIEDELLIQEALRRGIQHDPRVRRVLLKTLISEAVHASVSDSDFSEADRRAYFTEHREMFNIPAKAQVKRIFIAVSGDTTAELAQATLKDLKAKIEADPESFTSLAQEHSNGPHGRSGGDLGLLTREGRPGIPPLVVARAFELAEGAVSEPFEAAGGWNLVYVPFKRAGLERDYERMERAVLRQLKVEAYAERTAELLEKLKQSASIEIDEAAVAAFAPEAEPRGGLVVRNGRRERVAAPDEPTEQPIAEPLLEDTDLE